MGQLRGQGERRADAEGAEGPRVHPVTGAVRLDGLRRDGHHVAAVADVNGIVGQELVDLPGHPVGMDGNRVGGEHGHQLFRASLFLGAKFLHPCLSPAGAPVDAAGGGIGDGLEDGPHVADQTQRDVPVLAHGAVIHVDLDDGRVGAQALAVPHAEVERRAHDDDHVGLVEGQAPGAVEVMGVAGRQGAAAGPVHVGGNVEGAHEVARRVGAGAGPDLGAQQHARPFGGD